MKAFYVILALAVCVGCTCKTAEEQTESPKMKTETPALAKENNDDLAATAFVQTQKKDQDLATLVEGNNQFAFDLYHQLGQQPGNKFFSPYSISTALGMTYAGARGNTAKEMAQTLHFTLENDQLHPAFGELTRKIQGPDKKRTYELAVANSLWGNGTDLSLDPSFLHITQTDYQAGFQLVDFIKDAEGSRRTINGWVVDKTKKKFEELLPAGFIDANTRLILVNAIYFKGDWLVAFPRETTRPEDFTMPGQPAFMVPMMRNTFVANYTENEDLQLAQLMYKDNEVSMVVILPKKKDGLPDVEKKLSAKAMEQALALARGRELKVTIPKFKMTEESRLHGHLTKLGIKDAFLPRIADFTGIETKVGSQGSLHISEVMHKAFVVVDEQGTEAAAATAVGVERISQSIPPPPVPFRADHPFLFLIRHNATGSILFMGRIDDPRGN